MYILAGRRGVAVVGRLAQLARAPALQAGGHRFKSCIAQFAYSLVSNGLRIPPLLQPAPRSDNSYEKCLFGVFLNTVIRFPCACPATLDASFQVGQGLTKRPTAQRAQGVIRDAPIQVRFLRPLAVA